MLGSWKKERMLGRGRWGAAQLSLGGGGRASSGPNMCSRLIPGLNRMKVIYFVIFLEMGSKKREGLKKNTYFYPHFVDKRFTLPPLSTLAEFIIIL